MTESIGHTPIFKGPWRPTAVEYIGMTILNIPDYWYESNMEEGLCATWRSVVDLEGESVLPDEGFFSNF